jgi:hypothetical protein
MYIAILALKITKVEESPCNSLTCIQPGLAKFTLQNEVYPL